MRPRVPQIVSWVVILRTDSSDQLTQSWAVAYPPNSRVVKTASSVDRE